jgi:hypothetical protein
LTAEQVHEKYGGSNIIFTTADKGGSSSCGKSSFMCSRSGMSSFLMVTFLKDQIPAKSWSACKGQEAQQTHQPLTTLVPFLESTKEKSGFFSSPSATHFTETMKKEADQKLAQLLKYLYKKWHSKKKNLVSGY